MPQLMRIASREISKETEYSCRQVPVIDKRMHIFCLKQGLL